MLPEVGSPDEKGVPLAECPLRRSRRRDVWEEHALRRIVHLVFDRMRSVLEADHLGHLQLDVTVDEIIVEHAASLEERRPPHYRRTG